MTCATTEPVTFYYVENDNLPALTITYKDKAGTAVPITGFGFSLHIGTPTPTIVAGTIVDADAGIFEFVFGDGDLSPSGTFPVEIQITNAASKKLTIRNILFVIEAEIA